MRALDAMQVFAFNCQPAISPVGELDELIGAGSVEHGARLLFWLGGDRQLSIAPGIAAA
jgi:hypothetical protein